MKKHGINAVKAENAQLKAEIMQLKLEPLLLEFVTDLGKTMLTVLAATPYKDWPDNAKRAFAWTAQKCPTAAQLYKDRLPQE